jgi:autotransporter-associated beta strand protein
VKLATALMSAVLFGGAFPACAQVQRVLGTDISYWNCGTSATGISQNNWNTAFSTGNRKFVFIRATRGGTTGLGQTSGTPQPHAGLETLSRRYDDPRFIQNITRATAAGMFAGPYHFARPDVAGNTGTDEANHFIQMAGAWMRPGYLMPVFDQEAGSGSDALAQFAIDFSDRIYAVMQIRPAIYINGNYSSIFQGATATRRNLLAQPAANSPSVIGPAYPMLWNARYSDNSNPDAIPIQTGSPRTTYTISSGYYGPWDDYGNSAPWSFWQYASTVSIPGLNAVDATCDSNVSHGDIEYVRNYLVPAVWWHNSSGDWSTLANWNSGQTPVAPVTPPDQATPYATGPLPIARLPGAAGSGPTSGQYDTVILERPNANITVTLSSGNHNVRKLYVRETLNLTGGSLTINHDPTYRADDSPNVLHGGPVSAQFSGPVTLSGSGSLNVHTLQVDAAQTFTLAGGTLTINKVELISNNSTKLAVTGNVNVNSLNNATAVIRRSASTGTLDLSGGVRTMTVGNGTTDVDLSLEVPITNGGLTKSGAGTMRLTSANTYASGTILSAGRLLVNNPSGSGTGSGAVTVNGGILGGTGTIAGTVTINSGGTISPGTSIGTLSLNSAPTFNGTNFMEINRNGGSPLADNIVLTSGALNYGGTLVVSNTGATLLGGEGFTLFAASTYSGAFATTILPALSAELNWYTGGLTTDGTIKVNRRPVTSPLTFTNIAPSALQIPFATLTSAATDADGETLTLAGVNLISTNGIILTTNASSLTYSNLASVTDQFSYTITDGRGGSATGIVSIVNLGTPPSAQFTNSPSVSGTSVVLHFTGTPGWPYYLERSTNLVDWATISTNVTPPSGVVDYTDDFHDLAAPASAAFYRLRWSP